MLTLWQLDQIEVVLGSGGVIAYPTESVFGLGCRPDDQAALARILAIKKRGAGKGLIMLVSDISQATPFIKRLSFDEIQTVSQLQQRATTWLIEKSANASTLLSGRFGTLAVRITAHPIARQICQHIRAPLVSTSCNRAAKPTMSQVTRVRNQLHDELDYIVRGNCGGQRPSRIVDLASGAVLRE